MRAAKQKKRVTESQRRPQARKKLRARLTIEDRKAYLLQLGKEIFSRTSYDAVSTDELARCAGISKGLLYHYFPSKRQFYVETIMAVAEEILSATQPPPGVPFDKVIRHSLSAFVTFVENNAELFRALVRGGIGSDPQVDAIVERIREVTIDRVMEQWQVSEPSERLHLLLYGWVGYVEAVCLRWIKAPSVDRAEMVELLVRGLEPAWVEVDAIR